MKLLLVPESPEEEAALEAGGVAVPVVTMALGMVAARALMAAQDLGLLDALDGSPAGDLAGKLGLDLEGAEALLPLLASLDVVRRTNGGWTIGSAAAWLGEPAIRDLVRFNREQWDMLSGLEERIRHGSPDLHEASRGSDFWSLYQRTLASTAAGSCDEVAARLPLRVPRRAVDVGGGHGLYAAALCERFTSLEAVVWDLPDALAAGEPLCDHPRVRFEPGDVRTSTWGPADAVLMMNLLPHLDDAAARRAFEVARRSLGPGGVLAVLQPARAGEGATQLEATAALLYWLAAGRRPRPEATLRAWLREAGFDDVVRVDLVTARASLLLVARVSG